jgi:hypothetical protein
VHIKPSFTAAVPAALEDDDFGAMPAGGMAMGPGTIVGACMMSQPVMQPVDQLPEAKYSVWNALSLTVLMIVAGLKTVDLVRYMWQVSIAGRETLADGEVTLSVCGLCCNCLYLYLYLYLYRRTM